MENRKMPTSRRQKMTEIMAELEEQPVRRHSPKASTPKGAALPGIIRYLWVVPAAAAIALFPTLIGRLSSDRPGPTLEATTQQATPLGGYIQPSPSPHYIPTYTNTAAAATQPHPIMPTDTPSFVFPDLDAIIYYATFEDTFYSVMPDGTSLRELFTLSLPDNNHPDTMAVSRDRTKLVLLDGYPISLEDPAIYLVDIDTANPQFVDRGYDPIFSPDDTRMAYLKQIGRSETALFTTELGKAAAKYYTFTQDYEHARLMGWKSDGSFVMHLDCDIIYFSKGKSQVILQHTPAWGTTCDPWIHEVRLSPDERYLAYNEGGGLTTLHILRADGSGEIASITEYDVNDALGVASSPYGFSFSPDSRKIGFPCGLGYCMYDLRSKSWTSTANGRSVRLADW
jgi:hypothetical protein